MKFTIFSEATTTGTDDGLPGSTPLWWTPCEACESFHPMTTTSSSPPAKMPLISHQHRPPILLIPALQPEATEDQDQHPSTQAAINMD